MSFLVIFWVSLALKLHTKEPNGSSQLLIKLLTLMMSYPYWCLTHIDRCLSMNSDLSYNILMQLINKLRTKDIVHVCKVQNVLIDVNRQTFIWSMCTSSLCCCFSIYSSSTFHVQINYFIALLYPYYTFLSIGSVQGCWARPPSYISQTQQVRSVFISLGTWNVLYVWFTDEANFI